MSNTDKGSAMADSTPPYARTCKHIENGVGVDVLLAPGWQRCTAVTPHRGIYCEIPVTYSGNAGANACFSGTIRSSAAAITIRVSTSSRLYW